MKKSVAGDMVGECELEVAGDQVGVAKVVLELAVSTAKKAVEEEEGFHGDDAVVGFVEAA